MNETTDPVTETIEPSLTEPTYNIVSLDEIQFQTIVGISQRADLLANRVEILLILNFVFLALFLFYFMRSKT